MKIMTVLGTRPEIIRLSLIIPLLDRYSDHVLVHTGQNYTTSLSDVFFDELGVRAPDVCLGIRRDSFGAQIGAILEAAERVFLEHRPDRLLILGQSLGGTNAIAAVGGNDFPGIRAVAIESPSDPLSAVRTSKPICCK